MDRDISLPRLCRYRWHITCLPWPIFFNHILDLLSSLWDSLLPSPYLSLFDSNPLLFVAPASSPHLAVREVVVHLDVAPTHRLPPLISALTSVAVITLLPWFLPNPGVPRCVPAVNVSLVRLPYLFPPSGCDQVPVSPHGLCLLRVTYLLWIFRLHIRFCPYLTWPMSQSSAVRKEFDSSSLYPPYLCAFAALPVVAPSPGVFWCLVSLLGEILFRSESLGRIHSLVIALPGPRPRTTWSCHCCSGYPPRPCICTSHLVLVIPPPSVDGIGE